MSRTRFGVNGMFACRSAHSRRASWIAVVIATVPASAQPFMTIRLAMAGTRFTAAAPHRVLSMQENSPCAQQAVFSICRLAWRKSGFVCFSHKPRQGLAKAAPFMRAGNMQRVRKDAGKQGSTRNEFIDGTSLPGQEPSILNPFDQLAFSELAHRIFPLQGKD